ncbi:unnamed protein product [Periconia digitata]|uniref:Exoribonuclease phosphorolytic domain-containing protein n=1 Tax=Periconia digitata TaxID=1303443 RepID=A0A9W4UUJ9_9PLEO|nr:unnamed protein product [Periconia digitata]
MHPTTQLSPLHRADGSATYTSNGYTIIGAVNGPIEVQRRDELPTEATLEVNVRPAVGVGSPRERHLETLLHGALRSVVLTESLPRSLVQITLQVSGMPSEEGDCGVSSSLSILPHLLHTALLALLSASIPLSTILTAALVVIPSSSSTPLVSPTANQLLRAKPIRSAHVFAFSGDGSLLMNESDGVFSLQEWDEAVEATEEVCCKEEGGVGLSEGMEVDGREGGSLDTWLREVVRGKVNWEMRWKTAR